MSKEYWKASLEEIFEQNNIKTTVTDQLVEDVISATEMESEACGTLYIPNPLEEENKRLAKDLKKEREKIQCAACKGAGNIIDNFGPSRSSISQCFNCKGVGRVSQ